MRVRAEIATEPEDRRAEPGELRLIAAVLRQAIDDAHAEHRDAIEWIASDATDHSGRSFCFLDACHALSLDPEWAREQVGRGVKPARPRATRWRRLEVAA